MALELLAQRVVLALLAVLWQGLQLALPALLAPDLVVQVQVALLAQRLEVRAQGLAVLAVLPRLLRLPSL